MTMPVAIRLSAMCVAAAALTASTDALASHYYGIIINTNVGSDANSGAATLIRSDILHSTCNILTHTFVNHEMWYGVVAGNPPPYWVEVGFKDGATNGINCVTQEIFWADSRNGGGYHEHYYSNGWTLGDWYETQITSSGSCQWAVVLGGLALGTSTSNCAGSGRYLAGGIEANNQGIGSVKGFLDNWEELNGSWIQGWDGAGTSQSNPPNIKFLSGSETEEVFNEGY